MEAAKPHVLWLRAYGCSHGTMQVHVEYPKRRSMLLGRGWKAFARAHGLEDGHILCFKLAADIMLSVKFYGCAGVRLSCCNESLSGAECPSSSDSDEEDIGGSGALGRSGSQWSGVRNVCKATKMNVQPYELKSLSASLCSKEPREIHRGKISSILFPHITYFAYYIARGVLARDNTSNISAPDLAILAAALLGDNTYNIGALIARRLVANSGKGPHFGGIYATLILEHLKRTVCMDDTRFSFISFDLTAMKRHEFVTRTFEFGNLVYIMRFGKLTTREIRLPAPLLFDYASRNGLSFTSIELDEFVIEQQFHNSMEGVVPEEEEPSPWEASRASVY
ncbi:l-ascorbate oxidase-like protein [Hordeum vulgare]|nr:l-ascorbate oxidase-like protein [Hordeum vulgare]